MAKLSPVNVKNKRRIAIGFLVLAVLMLLLAFRVAWIQVVQADELTEKAIQQQTSDIPIDAKRGEIYDRNGKELATSLTCYSLWVRPSELAENLDEAGIDKLAQDLSAIVDEEAADIKKNLTKDQALVRVAKELEKEAADQIRDMEVSGLELSEETKRYYPSGNFASQLLGSVTDDGTGRTGIELQYDQYLSGVAGRWVKNTDVTGNQLVDGSEEYFEAKNGLNVVLTIDEAIQYYVEKALEEGMEETGAERIMCLVMDPETGEILASAVTPGYDPNNATEPDDEEELKAFKELSEEEQTNYLFQMWRNPIVSDTYEPGSTFKLITASSALDEGVISLTDTFSCNTKINVAGVTLHCWSSRDHGTQTIKQAIGNSCNPVLAQIAAKLGKEKGLPIIYLTHSARREAGMKNIFTASPEEFLNYLYYAECVVTSSFHGTALSVNLKKEFYYALDRKNLTANRRIEALMYLLGLQNRNILCQLNGNASIDWNAVNAKLDEQRAKSKEFLRKAIEGVN